MLNFEASKTCADTFICVDMPRGIDMQSGHALPSCSLPHHYPRPCGQ